MKRRDSVLAVLAAALLVLALLTVFAIELSNTQANSKRDVTARVHERAVLAAALIDGLFQTVQQQLPQQARLYGTRTVSNQALDRRVQQNAYLALLDPAGRVLAHSRGFTAQARSDLTSSAALHLLRTGHPFGIGNLLPYGSTGVINLGVTIPTAFGARILLTGFNPAALSTFLAGDLRKIPGVKGAYNYVLDGNNTVLASTNPVVPAGYRFDQPAQRQALARSSTDRGGRYYDQVPVSGSSWRIVLSAPDGPLFASVTGLRKWVPWVIFVAFALVAAVALLLGRGAVRARDQLRDANLQLELLNGELATTNATLERRAAELARSNAELEQFASIASHDLQEPLRKVRTFTQQVTVIESAQLSDQGRDYLERANSAAERMQKLIEDLLKFSRVATHGRPFTVVDLELVTKEVVEDLDAQVEHSGATIDIGPLPTIAADELQMRQLMQNLISNALKFHREGVAPEVTIEATVAADSLQLAVHDNGIGFEPQYSQRIFRVFERLHGRSHYSGTGIGLALCSKIVERHGGSIEARGEPGAGATFVITLPVRHATRPPSIARQPEAERKEAHVPA